VVTQPGPADRNLGAAHDTARAGAPLFGGLKESVVNLKCVAAPSTPQFRLRSLDGLRGLAAAIVLLHHLSMTIPAISNGYDSTHNVAPWSFTWWVLQSPLKVLVAGPEFVLVFFILSGFVLTLSPLGKRTRLGSPVPQRARTPQDQPASRRPYDWAAYYPRRIIRLGVPVVASMVLAFVVVTTLPHPIDPGDGSWLTRQAHQDTGLPNLLTETLLIADPSRPSVKPPLWSLTWELWFSLLLPVAVAIALFSRRLPVLWALVFCGISAYGYVMKVPAVMFLPAFALGGLLAANATRINAAIERQRGRRGFTLMWAAIAITGPMLCISAWLLRPLHEREHQLHLDA
jgi:peptidoglycan/LPS O-acetylase OafA/YrhL